MTLKTLKKFVPTAGFMSIISLALSCSSEKSKPQEAWNPQNEPAMIGSLLNKDFRSLPLKGNIDVVPWTDSYWPSYKGGLGFRWNDPEFVPWGDERAQRNELLRQKNFTYGSPSEFDIKNMSLKQLAGLSPAEKMDIASNDFNYTTLKSERARLPARMFNEKRVEPWNVPGWEGICHGWAPAALNFQQPKPVNIDVVLGDGSVIPLPFGSSDVKALLSLYQGNIGPSVSRSVALRCNENLKKKPLAADLPQCKDSNAGMFHIVLANFVGIQKKGFVADVTRDAEVWNHPVRSYDSEIVATVPPSPDAAEGTVEEIIVHTTMIYTVEQEPLYGVMSDTQNKAKSSSRKYKYRLELDVNGEIIGGEWISEDRPDFLWTETRPEFTGRWTKLGDIYQKSIQ